MAETFGLLCFNKREKELKENLSKMGEFYGTLVSWLVIRQRGLSLEKYFHEKGYSKVAIYGMKELGERLYDELEGTHIIVQYAIDQNANNIYARCEVVSLEDELEDVDAIIVTAIHYFGEIKEKLKRKMKCPIISISDIVREIEGAQNNG